MTKILPGVLKDGEHDRLWARREEFVADANLQPHWLYTGTAGVLGDVEMAYLRRFVTERDKLTEEGLLGFCYLGYDFQPPVMTRMSGMTGVLLRNFVRARIVPMGTLLDDLEKGERHDISVVLIPDFYSTTSKHPAWNAARQTG
jgi:hypothetical protein